MEKKKRNKKEMGITLTALVITVIIMLILAGVAISVLTSDGGLFEKTKIAIEEYENVNHDEVEKYQSLINNVDKYLNEIQNKQIITEISINYIGTSSFTVNINTNMKKENIKQSIIYLNGEEYVTTTEMIYTIENLSPETTYNIYVAVYDINNTKFDSNNKMVKTKERVYLYNSGDECIELTGGWKGVGVTDIKSNAGKSYSALAPSTITKREGDIYCQYYNNVQSSGGLSVTNEIDLTPYKKLVVDVSAKVQAGSWYRLLVTNDNTKYYNYLTMTQLGIYSNSSNTILDRGLITTDISSINQSAYIVFNYTKGSASTNGWIQSFLYNAWLEY